MFPAIYTTYGMAMGHEPETLAASGGLRPDGAERLSACPARVDMAPARRWLKFIVTRMRLRHRAMGSQTAGPDPMCAAALLCNQ
jgi:hypothetical protein